MKNSSIYLGVMSGTSLDGIDTVAFDATSHHLLAAHHLEFSPRLRSLLLSLQTSQPDELHLSQLAANQLADAYAMSINELLKQTGLSLSEIMAVGVHGQTIRHQPEQSYSIQLNQPARIAEQTGLTIVSDFRARDIAANGQGAPLVPAFHDALWRDQDKNRVIVNIGGFSNITVLNSDMPTFGYDTGPGNVLMDAWIYLHHELTYDANGNWASTGTVHSELLNALLTEPYFTQTYPKSTGRDYFHLAWLNQYLTSLGSIAAADVQATLLTLTATTIANEIKQNSPSAHEVIVCGGGAYNSALVNALRQALPNAQIVNSDVHGIAAQHVEAAAFAWLAMRTMNHLGGNLPAVTGAKGLRILGQVTFAA